LYPHLLAFSAKGQSDDPSRISFLIRLPSPNWIV